MSETPTPETDREAALAGSRLTVGAAFARTLERERDALRAKLATARADALREAAEIAEDYHTAFRAQQAILAAIIKGAADA